MNIIFDGTYLLNKNFGISRDAKVMFDFCIGLKIPLKTIPSGQVGRSFWKLWRTFQAISPYEVSSCLVPASSLLMQPQISPFFKSFQNRIVRLHDMFPITHPEWFTYLQVKNFEKGFLQSKRSNAIFVANSFYTRTQAIEFGVPKENIHVAAPIFSLSESGSCNKCTLCVKGVPKTKYVLTVGTIEPRKNYDEMFQFWNRMNFKNVNLIVIGSMGWKKKSLDLSENIKYLEYVCDFQLRKAYRGAQAYLSCSIDEGFNIPLEEANFYGIPIVASRIPVHLEKTYVRRLYRLGNFEEFEAALNGALDERKQQDSNINFSPDISSKQLRDFKNTMKAALVQATLRV